MKKMKLFFNVKKEIDWLNNQKGQKLIKTNGFKYTFEENPYEYNYEYIFFEKSPKELADIKAQVVDEEIEFVCNTNKWALFRKEKNKGDIHVYADERKKYQILMKKYKALIALSVCFVGVGLSQIAISTTTNKALGIVGFFFFLSCFIFFITAHGFKEYAEDYKDD